MTVEFQKLLSEFVSIPSVSTDIAYKKDIERASCWVSTYAKRSGLQVKTVKGFSNPIIIAKTKRDPNLKTVLVYGHYDVQPAKITDGWKSNPFSLTQKNGRLYGRGSADNKGQILMHLYSVAKLIKERRLGFNIIFLIEGNEETGSPLLKKFIKKNAKELKCDCVVISDGELGRGNAPALESSFRGTTNIEVEVETAKDDLHSGLFGGAVPNAAEELSKIISKIHNQNKRILVPDFYLDLKNKKVSSGKTKNSLKKLTLVAEPQNQSKARFTAGNSLRGIAGTEIVFAKNDEEYETRVGLEPAIEVTTFASGYMGEGFRNSIPSKALAKINVRYTANQNPKKLISALEKFMRKNTPEYVKLSIKLTDSSLGANLNLKNKFAIRAKEILKNIYKLEPVDKHSGGTLPIVNDFKDVLGVPQVMIPLANEDCGMHSASENITTDCIKKGLDFSYNFLSK